MVNDNLIAHILIGLYIHDVQMFMTCRCLQCLLQLAINKLLLEVLSPQFLHPREKKEKILKYSSAIYCDFFGCKYDDFKMKIVILLVHTIFLDGDVPRRRSYGVYISQLIRFARVCSHVDDFNTRNKC